MSLENLLLLGSGGREHAIAWKLLSSVDVASIFVSPGNGGVAKLISSKVIVVQGLDNHEQIVDFCRDQRVSMVVVGPEAPLAAGLADRLLVEGIRCFGPTKKAAEIESSKKFAKDFMIRHQIPTARYQSFTDAKEACNFIKTAPYPALVVKASGLAAGKGVVVAQNQNKACQVVHQMIENKEFGDAGNTIIIEELLEGEEISLLAFVDGSTIKLMPAAQDHKRLEDGDCGPNTGGMGVYCPCPQISPAEIEFTKVNILQKAVDGLRQEGRAFVGVLYAGLMLTKNGPKVLEFNCRFGDPECQTLLPLLQTDLFKVFKSCCNNQLHQLEVTWLRSYSSVTMVMASGGYPSKYQKGFPIYGIGDVIKRDGTFVFEAGTVKNGDVTMTSGGRVLAVTQLASTLQEARERALNAVSAIRFENAIFRSDIGMKGINFMKKRSLSYAESGVDIKEGNLLVENLKSIVQSTARDGSNPVLGGFGGFFDLRSSGYQHPVLVSGCDGVGTKLMIAHSMNRHQTIGIDLVAMCVNDVITHNAEPLFFLDYFACAKLNRDIACDVIKGIANGCQQAGCALIGGETAEMPGMYEDLNYDLAGFAVAAYDRYRDISMPRIDDVICGDVIIGLKSSGVHSNGFSLVRKVLEISDIKCEDAAPFQPEVTIGDILLEPTQIYVKELLPVLRKCPGIRSCAHITGGGLIENLPRILPNHLSAHLDATSWKIPPIFQWLAMKGNISKTEMLRTFNCGVGMCLVIKSSAVDDVIKSFKSSELLIGKIGIIEEKSREQDDVIVDNFEDAISLTKTKIFPPKVKNIEVEKMIRRKTKVAILISGSGSNMESIIRHSLSSSDSNFQVSLIISNISTARGLQRAAKYGIKTEIIDHRSFQSRMLFDEEINRVLNANDIELVCLAGFMRLLTNWFVEKWRGKVINIHPSLLPLFKGINAHEQVLESGVRVSGCTVHFVTEEMDAGAIISQSSVPVLPDDTIATLEDRVKEVEHVTYPQAVDLIVDRKVILSKDQNKVEWL